ncbi:MAG TPA: hypothetical protein VJ953_21920, partial [Saprospiraceae bacterium]|nr:hypothetical protein [Saprospiraceae bacterium]
MQISILAIFIVSLLTAFFYPRYRKVTAALISIFLLGVFSYFGTFLTTVLQGERIIQEVSWVPSLNIHFTFLLDGLSFFFAWLIIFFGLLVLIYSFK